MPDVPILPPGPSEEFLRRQEMMSVPRNIATAGSLDPSTGERQGMALSYNPVPPATSEMQMMEAIRQQVNALHFKNAQDALNASIQFQHMREAQRMRETGATDEQIWSRLGRGLVYANPAVLPNMVNQVRPVPTPSVTDMGGVKVLRSGLRGEHAQAVPQSALPQEHFEPRVFKIPGTDMEAVELFRGHYKMRNGDDISPTLLERIYTREITEATKSLEALPDNKKPDIVAKRNELAQKIIDANTQRHALTGPRNQIKPNEPAVKTAAPGYTVGKIYKGGLKYLGGDIKDQNNWEKVR